MKTKTLFSGALFFAVAIATAQIPTPTTIVTPTSVTLPDTIPNYDGSYDPPGQARQYYPSTEEIRFENEGLSSARDNVSYHTMNTYPQLFLLKTNNAALLFSEYTDADKAAGTYGNLHRIDLEWQKSNPAAFLTPVDQQENAQLNYFTQNFSAAGRTNVKGSAAVASQNIYPNIDLVYLSNNAGMVMYFIVYPGGNYKDIMMHINGSASNSISGSKLKIDNNWESMTFEKPQMYNVSMSGGAVTPVNVCNAAWNSAGTDVYSFYTTSSINPMQPLIIQVKQANAAAAIHTAGMNWSTYFGGGQNEFPLRTHTDASDNLYIAGYTVSNNLPQVPGVIANAYHGGDGFIVKFNSTGKLMWSTYMGGNGNDEIHDFDFNGSSIYCVGKTSSNDLVTVNKSGASPNIGTSPNSGNGAYDGFIFQFNINPVTSVINNTWLTYYGGNGDEELNGVKFDSQGNMFAVGLSASTDLNSTVTGPSGSYQQTFNAAQLNPSTLLSTDAIIAKFDAGTSAQSWFTFYGTDALGTNAHTHAGDYFHGLAIDGTNIYVCGKSGGTNLPSCISGNSKLNSGSFDGILVHFTTAGAIANAKYTDGNYANYSVKVNWGKVYTCGEANPSMSGNTTNSGLYYYNGTPGGSSDGCFSIHDAQYLTTIHNTFLGGSADDHAYDIQITTNGLFYIVGGTNSTDFPTWNLATMYNNLTGNPTSGIQLWDNFVACFQENSTDPTWSTYLGSIWNESGAIPTFFQWANLPAVTTIALNSQNFPYVLGITNSMTDYPLDEWTGTPVYFQFEKSGWQMAQQSNDATITRFNSVAINQVVGIKDFENTKFLLGIYPNPTAKDLVINNSAIASGDLRYAIYDMSGKKLKEGTIKATDAKSIDVSALPQGVYVVNVTNEKVTLSNKFVKTSN
jgi:hypothetical protein